MYLTIKRINFILKILVWSTLKIHNLAPNIADLISWALITLALLCICWSPSSLPIPPPPSCPDSHYKVLILKDPMPQEFLSNHKVSPLTTGGRIKEEFLLSLDASDFCNLPECTNSIVRWLLQRKNCTQNQTDPGSAFSLQRKPKSEHLPAFISARG